MSPWLCYVHYTKKGDGCKAYSKIKWQKMLPCVRRATKYNTSSKLLLLSNRPNIFAEKQGRRLFLLYLRPIINGTGNFYVEAQTRDETRTDLVVDYLGEQYVVELKIWRGKKYNEDGQKQLIRYLEQYHLHKGYLLVFNFNKKKQPGAREISIQGRQILEVTV